VLKKHSAMSEEKYYMINAGLWSTPTRLAFSGRGNTDSKINKAGDMFIDVTSIDTVLSGGRVSFIKLDVEGAELEALKGAKNTIKKYRPRLAVCLYHKPEDIIEIPLYIKSLVSDYNFYIRHHSTWKDETVLYCI
jgi:hypothetical protein